MGSEMCIRDRVNGGELTKAIKLKGIKTSKSVADLIVKLGGEIN